jgi:hypothetical protein
MKKVPFFLMLQFFVQLLSAQDITDAVRYGFNHIQGTARFQSLGGAFGALGGDLSAVNVNPAGSAIFSKSYVSGTLSSNRFNNTTNYFNSSVKNNDANIGFDQLGAAFVFNNTNMNSKVKRFVLSLVYDRTQNTDNSFQARGTTNQSIDRYFLANAQGLELNTISSYPDETLSQAYNYIGANYGYSNQQAFLGYESFILEPDSYNDNNTLYYSNIAAGSFNQSFNYYTSGYNGKLGINLAMQYEEKLYLGLNLNAHTIEFRKSTYLKETNSNPGSLINSVEFSNDLSVTGSGFSFQLGGIYKVNPSLRLGLTYDSPTWYTIAEESTQSIFTRSTDGILFDDGSVDYNFSVDPNSVNVYPEYRLETPGKITASGALILGKIGLISFDYALKDYSNTKFRPVKDSYFAAQNEIMSNALTTSRTFRLGGEVRVERLSVRGGYALIESPYLNKAVMDDSSTISFGLGYNFGNTRLDLSFSTFEQNRTNQLYQVGTTDSAPLAGIQSKNSNIFLTLGFNL